MAERIILGSIEVCFTSREAFIRGDTVTFPWRTFDVLQVLIQARGEVVRKEEILRRVWGDEFVDDSNLTHAVAQIRKVLDPPPEGKSYIETVSRIGYRLPMSAFIKTADPMPAPAATAAPGALVISTPKSSCVPLMVGRPPPDGSNAPTASRRFGRFALIGRTSFRPLESWKGIAFLVLLLSGGLNLFWIRNQDRLGSGGRIANPSVAVLPLEGLSADPEQEYFTDGLTDALTTNLAKIRGLRVISRTSTLAYKKARRPVSQIARELGVDYVVEGTVQRAGDRVRITAQLIAVAAERHIWAESYERDLGDILALQGEVARVIAREVRVQLTPQDQARLASIRPVNRYAYEAYLKGRYYQAKRTEDGLKKSVGYFQEAVGKDSGYGQAYSGLADSETYLANHGFLAPRETAPRAKAMAVKALDIDDTLAEAHTSLAYVRMVYDWDWPGAEREFRRAIDIDPGYARAHSLFACYFALQRRFDEALAEIRRALEFDPLSIYDNTNLGWHLQMARRYDESIEQYRKTLDMDPGSAHAHDGFGRALEQKAMYGEAIAEFQKAIASAPNGPPTLADLAHAYASCGKRSEAHEILQQLRALSKHKYVPSYHMAIVYTALGNQTEAFASLDKAYQERDGYLWLWLNLDPRFDPLRPDPRFIALLGKMRLPI